MEFPHFVDLLSLSDVTEATLSPLEALPYFWVPQIRDDQIGLGEVLMAGESVRDDDAKAPGSLGGLQTDC